MESRCCGRSCGTAALIVTLQGWLRGYVASEEQREKGDGDVDRRPTWSCRSCGTAALIVTPQGWLRGYVASEERRGGGDCPKSLGAAANWTELN